MKSALLLLLSTVALTQSASTNTPKEDAAHQHTSKKIKFQLPKNFQHEAKIFKLVQNGEKFDLQQEDVSSMIKVSSDLNMQFSGLGVRTTQGFQYNEATATNYTAHKNLVFKRDTMKCKSYDELLQNGKNVASLIDEMNDPFNNPEISYEGFLPADWDKEEKYHIFTRKEFGKKVFQLYYSPKTSQLRYSVMIQDNGKYIIDMGASKVKEQKLTARDFQIKECSYKNVFLQ
ncbi:UNKNOWN [Stylonychia lemnae]|uniref:Uncharacterized protein n=1 Tax=Stylonychia lemnae TaxID=5949 RepID=A0A078B291_STYLE|nr:UNKNOWN [Stylonychia lemnae]|eukprot:CDW88650.1 UNKNOWN [Stylonychia lemnae]